MILEPREPMLSAKEKQIDKLLSLITYPKLASPKMDGFRAVNYGGLFSRKLKPFPNRYTMSLFSKEIYAGLDGELIVGNPWDFSAMQQTSSGVTSQAGTPEVKWYVFDDCENPHFAFERRLASAERRVKASGNPFLRFVPHELVRNEAEMLEYEDKCLTRGYEGIMLRDPLAPYKFGRATMKQNWLVAVKRFVDFEATIIAVHEQMHNGNMAETNELGRTKRSGHKANKSGLDTLGGFTCVTAAGVDFRVGGGKGLTAAERARLWAIRDHLPGQKAKCQGLVVGTKVRPRHPSVLDVSFLTIRPDFD